MSRFRPYINPKEIARQYQAGHTTREIAATMKCCKSLINTILKEQLVALRPGAVRLKQMRAAAKRIAERKVHPTVEERGLEH